MQKDPIGLLDDVFLGLANLVSLFCIWNGPGLLDLAQFFEAIVEALVIKVAEREGRDQSQKCSVCITTVPAGSSGKRRTLTHLKTFLDHLPLLIPKLGGPGEPGRRERTLLTAEPSHSAAFPNRVAPGLSCCPHGHMLTLLSDPRRSLVHFKPEMWQKVSHLLNAPSQTRPLSPP